MMIQQNPEKEVKFNVRDQVWLEAKNLKFPSETPKFKPKCLGPFRITRKIGKMNYELELPFQWKNHPVFHATLLTPYRETKEHSPNYIKPPLDLIDGQEEYEVEAILGHCFKGHTVEYLTAWKAYGSNNNAWEPEENLTNANKY